MDFANQVKVNSRKEKVETIYFIRMFLGFSGFTRLHIELPVSEEGFPVNHDSVTYVIHLMDKKKSEFTAFLKKLERELLVNKNEERIVINEKFVL